MKRQKNIGIKLVISFETRLQDTHKNKLYKTQQTGKNQYRIKTKKFQ